MIEDKIQKAIKPIMSVYAQIELDIIEKIAEHFKLNEEFINSDYWYFEKLKEMGGLNNETIKLLEKYTGRTKQELLKAMKDIGTNAIPTEQLNIATQKGILLNPQSIINSVNIQNIIKYSYDEIEKSFLQLNKTIEEQVKQTYKNILTQTYIKTLAGTHSYQEAILESLDDLGNKGISIITYQDKNGLKRNYDVVGTVRRDLLVATRGLAGKVNEEIIKESGHHIVRVSHHFGARTGDGGENYTNHAWWQGKQFFCWNYDGKATEEEKKLPDFIEHCNYGDVQGIVGINCKHFFTVWYGSLEKDKLDFTYEENEEQYKKSQNQRYLENGIRKWKRKQVIANKTQDEEGYKKASKKVKEWQDRLSTFTEENELKRDYVREHIKDYKNKKIGNNTNVTFEQGNNSTQKEMMNWQEKNEKLESKIIKPYLYKDKTTEYRINKYENEIMDLYKTNQNENMAMLELDTGKLIGDLTKGQNKTITGPTLKTMAKVLTKKANTVIAIHNHPSNHSFSLKDIQTFNKIKQIDTMIVLTDDYKYYLRNNNVKLTSEYIQNNYRNIASQIKKKYNYLNGVEKRDLINQEFFKKVGWIYEKEKN